MALNNPVHNVELAFDNINTIYGEIINLAVDDEGDIAEKTFVQTVRACVFTNFDMIKWDWENKSVIFKVGTIKIRTHAQDLSDDAAEVVTELYF